MKRVFILAIICTMLFTMTSCNNSQDIVSDADIDNLSCLVDLHLHLDGAISLESAKELAAMQGIECPDTDEEILDLLRVSEDCKDLNEFLDKFDFSCSLIQTKDGIRQAVINLLSELKEQGVMYAEIRFAPQKSCDKGLSQEEAVVAAIEGIQSSDINANLILSCMRGDDTHDKNIETINIAKKHLGKGVVAVDLAGAEGLYPTSEFEDIFDYANEKGIPFTIHAGEADGPDSVRKAVEMGASRIGHGVRALEDESLVKEIVDKQIALELCPSSNICTGIFKTIAEWPFEELYNSGMIITINTDDPSVEGTTIKDEYKKLVSTYDIGRDELKNLFMNSINASFADETLKNEKIEIIKSNFDR